MYRELKEGALVELMIDANAIPAGRYRFLEQDGEMLILSVAPEILVGINTTFWGSFIRPSFDARAVRTPPKVFINQYYANVARLRGVQEPFCPDKLTFCILGPRYYQTIGDATFVEAPAQPEYDAILT